VGQRSSHAVEAREGSPTHVTAAPDVQAEEFEKHQGVKRWDHLESSAGGNDKSTEWRAEKGGGAVPWLAAAFFIVLIGSMPVVGAVGSGGLTKTHVLESAFLYTWLLGGLYMFTNVLIFQSPHFQHPRPLCLEESVYLFAQILTTVGYGDITPARPRGQLCVGIFVLTAVLLISSMVQDMLGVFRAMMEASMDGADEGERSKSPRSEKHALKKAFEPVVYASIVFCFFAAGGTLFFTYYPGEEKNIGRGSLHVADNPQHRRIRGVHAVHARRNGGWGLLDAIWLLFSDGGCHQPCGVRLEPEGPRDQAHGGAWS